VHVAIHLLAVMHLFSFHGFLLPLLFAVSPISWEIYSVFPVTALSSAV